MNSFSLNKSNPPAVEGKTKPFFQPKISINKPNDSNIFRNEQETDAVANKVLLKADNECKQKPFFSPAVQLKKAEIFTVEKGDKKTDAMADQVGSMGVPFTSLYRKYSNSGKKANAVPEKPIKTRKVHQTAPDSLIQKQDDGLDSPQSIEPVDEVETTGSPPEEAPNVTIELPLPMTIRVNGVMFTSPTFLLEGPNGRIVDLAPYTGSGLLDFPLAALESLGIPVLSFYHFHFGRARQFRGRHFESAYALSGGTSFIRNALHYGYITADDVNLFGAPSSFNLEHYGGIPNLNIVANPMDIGTMINVSYFNYPLFEGHNNPAVLFSITAPFDQNPFEAFTNLGGAIYHALSGDLYNLPGVTHSYPRFQREPTDAIGSPYTRTRVSRKADPGSVLREEKTQFQRKESNTDAKISPSTESYINTLSGGRSLTEKERSFFEPRMEYDFSKVRLHTDNKADQSAKNVNALAFAKGNNIVFRAGQYQPDTDTSKKLLAHELTHVIQQNTGSAHTNNPVSEINTPWEIVQRDETSQSSDVEEVCEDLRSALANSIQVIDLYHAFLEGNIQWEDMQSQRRMVGNAAQGVVGAGLDLPPIVQEAIAEVESFGFEEIRHMGRLAMGLIGSDEFFQSQWATNEIERQNHYNLVLIRFMYENGCPDFPGQWSDFQQQILPIGTKGLEQRSSIETTPRETRTAIAWVEIGDEHILVLATEVANAGQLRFERWIDSDFRELALGRAASIQGSIPSVPGSAVRGLPASVPGSAARR